MRSSLIWCKNVWLDDCREDGERKKKRWKIGEKMGESGGWLRGDGEGKE